MKNLLTFLPAFLIASTVVAEEPTAAKYFAQKVTNDSGYTQTLMMPDGTLEYVVAFTTVNDESNPHTWQVPANVKDSKIDYLVVAGGGGGGAGSRQGGGGGGGAGGMLTGTILDIPAIFSITVGAGGNKGIYSSTSANCRPAGNGGNSSIIASEISIQAIGGGAGGSAYSQDVANGSVGGSGGGGAGTDNKSAQYQTIGGDGTSGQGNNGGNRGATTGSSQGAGGGGAGGDGASAKGGVLSQLGHGGEGLSSYIIGEEAWYAGGGGGGTYGSSPAMGIGGNGGGGSGVNYLYGAFKYSSPGLAGTGGGGGGGRGTYPASNGGSGIVVLRYALNNDGVFQGIVVDTTTEKLGTPSPAYDIYKTIPGDTYTCPRFSDVSEGVRAVCVGWELWSKDGTATVPIREFTDDYRTTESTSDLTYSRKSGEEGVVLKWKIVKEYYVSTVASCERGSLVADKSGWYRAGDTIQVAITSMDNFIGWGGWGTGAQRSLEQSKTITVVAAPMTITAYFTAHDKDNLVLNGNFQLNNNPSIQDTIINGTGNLTAGNWERINGGYSSYPSGLVTTYPEKNSQVKSYSGLSAIICSSSASKDTRKNGTIKCTVQVPCSGLYDLSFMNDTGYANSGMNGLKWTVDIDLINSDNTETYELVNLQQKAAMNWHQENFKVRIPRGGLYTLQFSLDRYSIANDPEASASKGTNASSAFDNIELKLDKRFGFFIKVR